MNKKKFDWYTFRNDTAAKIVAARCANTNWSFYASDTSGISGAVDIADELVRILMNKEKKINDLIAEYESKQKKSNAQKKTAG